MNKVTNTENNPMPQWLMGGNPDAIEAQEAQGQKELVISSQLPAKVNYPRGVNIEEQYTLMGIEVIGQSEDDPLFLDVKLPAGWKKEATDSMWNKLIDDKGRVRATFFYKAAFYDRNAFINFDHRYIITREFADEKCTTNYDVFSCVKDQATGEIIFQTEATSGFDNDLRSECISFLKKTYPNYEELNAYWD